MSDKVCPFCDEADFDMVGLKIHLNAGDCYAFNDTPGPARTVRLGDARASRPRAAGPGPFHPPGTYAIVEAYAQARGRPATAEEIMALGFSLGYAEFVDIVFDGPPGPEAGRFVEVEERGRSISVGEWIDRGDGCWALRIRRA